jgi:hypothetical protein
MEAQLLTTLQTILSIAGGLTILAGGIGVIVKMGDPYKKVKEKVDKHEQYLDNDNKRLVEIEKNDKIICQILLAMLNHMISGNDVDELKKERDELQEYLCNK